MIKVGGAEVRLNSGRNNGSWTTELPPYELAAHPVSQADYAELTGAPPSSSPQPATDVSWWDAVRYCNTLSLAEGLRPAYRFHADGVDLLEGSHGYRLPSEAEWEHGCCAPSPVWEWAWDLYDPQVYGTYRVQRGNWSDLRRSSERRRGHPALAGEDVGFRVARAG